MAISLLSLGPLREVSPCLKQRRVNLYTIRLNQRAIIGAATNLMGFTKPMSVTSGRVYEMQGVGFHYYRVI